MSVLTVLDDGRAYAWLPESPPPVANRTRAVLRARLADEISGDGLAGVVRVATTVSGLAPRIAADGVAGLVGNPQQRFPDLAATPAEIEVTFSAPRYIARTERVTIGPFNTGGGAPADFPDHFEAADLGVLHMHRAPVVISGRTVQTSGSERVPLAGVSVEIVALWRALPGPDDDPTLLAEAPDLLSLDPGLYRARAAGATLRRRQIVVGAPPKRLLAPVVAGALRVRVSDRVNLIAGELLAVEPGIPGVEEVVRIDAIEGALSDISPATVILAHPLARGHDAGGSVAPAAPAGAPGPVDSVLRDAIPGDATVHLASLAAGLPALATFEIAGGALPEYQTARRYSVLTGPGGDYRLPPLSRAAMVRIEASRPDLPAPVSLEFGPDYSRHDNRLDFVFRP